MWVQVVALMKVMEILVRLLQYLVQMMLLYTGQELLESSSNDLGSALPLWWCAHFICSSALPSFLWAASRCQLNPPSLLHTFSFLYSQQGVAPTLHLSIASITFMHCFSGKLLFLWCHFVIDWHVFYCIYISCLSYWYEVLLIWCP